MKGLLNQAANAAVRTKGSIFEFIYRRLVHRLGVREGPISLAKIPQEVQGNPAFRIGVHELR